jgi:hypothetical protein
MSTAQEIVSDILQEITVQAPEQSVLSVDFQTVIRYINRFMSSLDATGTKLGYTLISNPSDAVTIPAGAEEGLIFNIALRLCTTYDIAVSQDLMMKAKDSLNIMNIIGNPPPKSSYPGNLPIGSGNYQNTYNNFKFYDGHCEDDPTTCETYNEL